MIFALQNIRSAWNVGQIFRTADALGASIACIGYTARPNGHSSKQIQKTAIGAEKNVPWQAFASTQEALSALSSDTYLHLAIEITPTSLDLISTQTIQTLESVIKDREIVLWLGNEIAGLDQTIIHACEYTLHLPMKGSKESLNVSNVATTVGYILLGLEHLD